MRFPLQACSLSKRMKGAALELVVARVVRAAAMAACLRLWGGVGRLVGECDGGGSERAEKQSIAETVERCGNGSGQV